MGDTMSLSNCEWKEYKLEDLADVFDYKRIPLSNMERQKKKGMFPYYGASGIIDYLDSYIFEGNYLLISEDGENLRSRQTPIAFEASGRFWVNNHAHIIKGKKDYLNRLIKYYFAQLDLSPFITGAVQPKLSQENLYSIPFDLPTDEKEQLAIVSVLSSLDDKIDLLHRQNKTLDALAETLFRQWFVEEGTEYILIGNVANVTTGKGLKREEFIENGEFPILGANGEIGRTNKFLTESKLILTGRVGTLGKVYLSEGKVWISDNVLIVNPYEEKFFYPIYFHLKTVDFESLNVGSTQPLVTQTELKKIEFKIPTQDIFEKFTMMCDNSFEKISKNKNQIHTLTQLRDTLLPKLMSGEIRLNLD